MAKFVTGPGLKTELQSLYMSITNLKMPHGVSEQDLTSSSHITRAQCQNKLKNTIALST